MSQVPNEFGRDGRRIIDPPCEYGHTRQAMECPSCSQHVTGEPSSAEWVKWYEQRSGRRKAVYTADTALWPAGMRSLSSPEDAA